VNDVPALPAGPLAAASLSIVQATASAPIAGHSIRTFCYARLLAGHEASLNDAAYDEDLLFAACVMHDLGLGSRATGQARFEVEGADLAATVLTGHGVAAAEVDRVWEAIALHSSAGIAHRRGLLTYLTSARHHRPGHRAWPIGQAFLRTPHLTLDSYERAPLRHPPHGRAE
jgi:hypothetical protein